jgi:hypothetical protein
MLLCGALRGSGEASSGIFGYRKRLVFDSAVRPRQARLRRIETRLGSLLSKTQRYRHKRAGNVSGLFVFCTLEREQSLWIMCGASSSGNPCVTTCKRATDKEDGSDPAAGSS